VVKIGCGLMRCLSILFAAILLAQTTIHAISLEHRDGGSGVNQIDQIITSQEKTIVKNQNFPITITKPGLYVCKNNAFSDSICSIKQNSNEPTLSVITVDADNVHINLNSFTLQGSCGTKPICGIRVKGGHKNITISNGSISDFYTCGICLSGSVEKPIYNVRLRNLDIMSNGTGICATYTDHLRNDNVSIYGPQETAIIRHGFVLDHCIDVGINNCFVGNIWALNQAIGIKLCHDSNIIVENTRVMGIHSFINTAYGILCDHLNTATIQNCIISNITSQAENKPNAYGMHVNKTASSLFRNNEILGVEVGILDTQANSTNLYINNMVVGAKSGVNVSYGQQNLHKANAHASDFTSLANKAPMDNIEIDVE
jgi:hypothetical protein